MKIVYAILFCLTLSSCTTTQPQVKVQLTPESAWLLIDNFEQPTLINWHKVDTQNNTQPYVPSPQITEIRSSADNQYLLKKPAADGVVGNRKALSFKALPTQVSVGERATFFTRLMVKSFPNNHAFGLSNLRPEEIIKQGYNAFEPTLRVTDKSESNGFKNDGTLMVKVDSDDKYRQYSNVQNFALGTSASPLETGVWYRVWYVVNNKKVIDGGQTYDVYLKGGEFKSQTLVFKGAQFRMKREKPLIYFFANTNTGSIKKPYGNGGLAYDDIYMSKDLNLSDPTVNEDEQ